MVQQLFDDLLHLRTKHTNRMIPFSEYIGIDKFPKQAKDIGTTVKLKYRDNNRVDYNEYISADEFDPHNVFEKDFIILRHDEDEPRRFIATSTDYSIILIKTRNNYPEDQEIILRYPIQYTNIIGLEVMNHYIGVTSTVAATILRADRTEPSFALLVEEIAGKIRFVLGDECMSKLNDVEYDYDGKYADTNEPVYEDVDGRTPKDNGFIPFLDMVDGGDASGIHKDPPKRPRIEDLGKEKSQKEITEIVRKCIEGKKLWS